MTQTLHLPATHTSPRTHARRAPENDRPPAPTDGAWEHERRRLLDMLAHQQRVAQAGLMTAGLAHDVNNHIQAVSGFCYLALLSDDPARWKEALEKVQQHCRDLSETTNAFMAFVRRRGATTRASFLASEAVEQAHRIVAALAKKHGVALATTLDGDGCIGGEKRLAIQALVNLSSNAIRACAPTQGTVVLAVRRPAPERVRIEVQDNGPGIPPALQETMFTPFETGYAGQGGNGIGLYVVEQCSKELGGQVRVRTSANGTTFTIEIPTLTD